MASSVDSNVTDRSPPTPILIGPTGFVADEIMERFKSIGLTGRVISVTNKIPCMIGLDENQKISIAAPPLELTLDASISSISESEWQQIIIGWSGHVLPTQSNTFQEALGRGSLPAKAEDITRQLRGSIPDLDPGYEAPPYYLALDYAEESTVLGEIPFPEVVVDRRCRAQLDGLLQREFGCKVIPVWVGKYQDENAHVKITIHNKDAVKFEHIPSTISLRAVLGERYDSKIEASIAKSYKSYKRLNKCVAEAIVNAYHPGDIIWIHTNQHLLLPRILRERLPTAFIVYHQQEAWGTAEDISKLYKHHKLMTALLAASIIVLPDERSHTFVDEYYENHKEATVNRAFGLFGYPTATIINAPTCIDLFALEQIFKDDNVKRSSEIIRAAYPGKKIIVLQARIDQMAGIMIVFGAYRHLLRTDDWKHRIVLIVLLTPICAPLYQMDQDQFLAPLTAHMLDINSRFGSTTYTPVVCLARSIHLTEYYGLLKVADVGIAVDRHGLANDMARAFVVAQADKTDVRGSLLVATWSTETDGGEGRVDRLLYGKVMSTPEAVDDTTTLDAFLPDVLAMSSLEQQNRHFELYKHFIQHYGPEITGEVVVRIAQQLTSVEFAQGAQHLPFGTMLKTYVSSKQRLLIFDYDGTLTPIVNNPDDAVPTAALLGALQKFGDTPETYIYIVSGRSRQFLDLHFRSFHNLGLSAEHGCYIKPPGAETWQNKTENLDLGWKMVVDVALNGLAEKTANTWVERKDVAIVWHYRNALDHEACLEAAKEAKALLESAEFKDEDMEVVLGKANLEVRPRSLNKGSVVKELLSTTFGLLCRERFVLCVGDDTTDEDMFRGILSQVRIPKHCYTFLVGEEIRPTMAQYRVKTPEDVVRGLVALSEAVVAE